MMAGTGVDTFVDIYTVAMNAAKQPTTNTTLLNRFKDWINIRNRDFSIQKKWPWLLGYDVQAIVGKYTTGTVTVTNGSATVTGSSTVFTGKANYWFKVDGYDEIYEISSVASATSLTLADNYNGTTASAKSYVIWKDTYELANTIEEIDMVWSDHQSTPAIPIGPNKMRELKMRDPTSTGKARAWTTDLWSSDGDRQLVIWPVPDEAYNLHYYYYKRIVDLSATTDEPLMPQIYRHALVYGALAEFHMSEGDAVSAQAYEGKYVDMVRRAANDVEQSDDYPQVKIIETWRRNRPSGFKYDYGDLWDRYDIED